MTVHLKLVKARLALQGKQLNKSGHNKFAGYKYFELGDFLPVVQEIFAEHGLCGVVSYTAELATLTITATGDGTSLTITSPMGSAQLKGCHEVQNIGAVETYQRRYLWVTAMEIVEHDALDAVTGSAVGEPVIDIEPVLQGILQAETIEDLQKLYKQAFAKFGHDAKAVSKIVSAKDSRKEELSK